ncbi:MAG: lipopolysaccharide assembly protein LapA domain-containing protein [Candidatus Arsenophonus melophagi]|nr:lipopolysaccharide assembly protein LapA domain-containing protein [Candidatus Arsenophonus melophagi]
MKYFLILLLSITIFIVSVVLSSSNDQIITFNYLIAKGNYPISTLLATIFVIGFLLGLLVCGIFYAKALISLTNVRRNIKKLERQLVRSPKMKHDTTEACMTKEKR